jgi:hypothetical protein
MDVEAYITVAATVAVAIACGMITYRVSIVQAKKEIKEAFDEHIQRMHVDHKEFIQAVKSESKE